jgi:hypothetical protein
MSSKNALVPGPVKTVKDPVFEVLDETMSKVFFQAVYETLALFSSRFSKVILATVGVGFGVEEGFGAAEALAVGAGDGFATGINTPLFHTNFLPLFTQVYVFPALTLLIPALLQELPAFTAPIAGAVSKELKNEIETTRASVFLMNKRLLSRVGFVSIFL